MKTFLAASISRACQLAYSLLIILIIIIAFIKVIASNKPKQTTVTIRNQTFLLEVADNDNRRAKGLSKRDSINNQEGMLFIFDTAGFYSFWMKEMKFPIDILFIKDNKIVTIYQSVPNPKNGTALTDLPLYKPREAANYVLEINAGLSQKYGFEEGDMAEIKLP
ncbi:DUF192 domain-containing protein [Candidatus Microgenomates bacterium]|nr:DUF192 domain-containing protein [Candidatus Microgenomates bacterium]